MFSIAEQGTLKKIRMEIEEKDTHRDKIEELNKWMPNYMKK